MVSKVPELRGGGGGANNNDLFIHKYEVLIIEKKIYRYCIIISFNDYLKFLE